MLAIDPPLKRRGAFTLVELLVSVAVLAVIVVLLTGVLNSAAGLWESTNGRSERHRGARILTDFIGPELRAAMLPVETVASAGQANLQFLINPPEERVPADCSNPHSIFWHAPIATERSMGDIAALGYFVKWETDGALGTPALRRFFVNPTSYNPSTRKYVANPNFLTYQSHGSWLNPALLSKAAPASKESGYVGLFAEGVVGLWIRFYGIDGKEITTSADSKELADSFDSRVGYEVLLERDASNGGELFKREKRYLPLEVAVSIAQVDSRYSAHLRSAWEKVRALANTPATRDAQQFVESLRYAADQDAALRAILPGVRAYETRVMLENAR